MRKESRRPYFRVIAEYLHTHYDPLTFLDPCPNWFTDWRGIGVAMGGQGAIKSMGRNNFQNSFKPADDTVYGSFLIALV